MIAKIGILRKSQVELIENKAKHHDIIDEK